MQKFGTGQILTEDDQPIQRTATARQLSFEDVQDIEAEGQTEGE
jgi:hypothetical protein